MKKTLDDNLAGLERVRKSVPPSSTPAEREQLLASLKQSETTLRNPETQKFQRAGLEEDRAKQRADEAKSMKSWEDLYPVDPQTLIAGVLRRFLDATAGVDFTLKLGTVRTEAGDMLGFVDRAYENKPWQWVECVVVGKEAVTAARSAAEAWLKELGAR